MVEQQIWTSWNGNIRHGWQRLHRIRSEQEIQSAVVAARSIRAYGTGQSSADICAGTESLIDIRAYSRVLDVDREKKLIRVESGILLSEFLETLKALKWMLPCLPDNDSITLGGAIATGTHGTNGKALGEYMLSCRLVHADGSVSEYDSSSEVFPALRCSLGLLGIMSEITMQCEDEQILKIEEEPVKEEIWIERWPQWLEENQFLRILSLPHSGYGYVIKGNPVPADGDENNSEKSAHEIQAPNFVRHRREVSRLLYKSRKPAFVRLSNTLLKNLFFSHKTIHSGNLYDATVTKSRSSTLELAEWSVVRDDFPRCFNEFRDALHSDKKAYAHIPMDIRFLDSNESWLSNAYQKNMVTVGCITRNPESASSYRAFDLIEHTFLRFGARPHWAKHFATGGHRLSELYPKWENFISLRRRMDPRGKFLNSYLETIFQ